MRWSSPFAGILEDDSPQAVAVVTGNNDFPELMGVVEFYRTPYEGILVIATITGLPMTSDTDRTGFYAMHIHEYGDCTVPFDKTGMHYNPSERPHPEHAGDLLPLLSNDGYAWSAFYDVRFKIEEVIGRSVIIHKQRDDFTTQPSGDAGEKIGCGTIVAR